MPCSDIVVRPVGMRRALQRTMLCCVSLLALSVAGGFAHARSLTPGAGTVAPTAAAQQAGLLAAQQAAAAAAQAQASLARAAAALAAARKLQSDAAAAAKAAGAAVPNGLTTGGLMPSSDPAAKWLGALAPLQTTNGSRTRVDINQTQQKSILYWDTFNVGANTTVNFRQGASDWIALNRVLDPTGAPSRILGQINAPGAVYLINRNGIIFGAGSQTNVHTLVASSLDVGQLGTSLDLRDQYFLNSGIANLNSFSIYDKDGGARTTIVAGDIKVERGASITGNIQSDRVALGSPGSVYLFGANVSNSGAITVPAGEVAMVAARTIDVVPSGYFVLPDSVLGKDDSGKSVGFRGTEFQLSHFDTVYRPDGYPGGIGFRNSYLPGTGAVAHDGLVDVARGIVVMSGDAVRVDNPKDAGGGALRDSAGRLVQGVISVDTSVDRNSMVLLRAATSVTMNGVISSLPLDDGAPGLVRTQSFTPAYIEMTAQSNVTVGSDGLVSAPAAQVSLRAIDLSSLSGIYQPPGTQRLFTQGGSGDTRSNSNTPLTVLLAPGATIDVAGLANVALPASYNVVSFQPRAEFADMPLQRIGPLYGKTLHIDIRNSGTRSDGTPWVGTPLADASGYVANVPRSIYQLMTLGGSISLLTDLTSTASSSGGSRVETAGSIMNVAGGSVKFQSGLVNDTRLIGSDGRIYGMANADPNMSYLGVCCQFTVNHARWGVTETWSTGTQILSPGYSEGHDAGKVTVTTDFPSLLGTIYFGSTAGERQIGAGQLPSQGALALTTPSSVQIGATASADYVTQSAYTTRLSADTLSGYGLSALSVTANDFVLSGGSALNLAAGGSLSVIAGGAIDIAGTVSAAGGSANLVTDRGTISQKFNTSSAFKPPTDRSGRVIAASIFVEGTIDVSGRFVNDIGRVAGDAVGPAFINGGAIAMTTNKDSTSVTGGYLDATGSILLAQSSLLDVSSGGYVNASGKARMAAPGIMAGRAGSISLAIYSGAPWDPNHDPRIPTPSVSTQAVLALDGTLRGYGFESNGSLRLAAADTVRIGGALQPGETSTIRIGGVASTLPTSLLTGGGFGSYTLESVRDDWSGAAAGIILSAGTRLTLQQQNLSSLSDYTATPTGTPLGQQAAPQLALLADNQRKPVSLALKADSILLDTGARLVTDPRATITMAAVVDDRDSFKPSAPEWTVPAQSVELRGSIVDHGGTVFINALKTHLSSQAEIDLSGTFLANALFGATNGPGTSSTSIAGGTFAVEAGKINGFFRDIFNPDTITYAYQAPKGGSYLVADAGALLDVSGAAGNIQVAGARGATSSVRSWSDAGTVSADVAGFAFGGRFAAAGGRSIAGDGSVQADARANGGTILLGGGSEIRLRQNTTDVTNALAAYRRGSAPASLFVAADQLAPFDNVYLYAGAADAGATRFFDLPGYSYGYAAPVWGTLRLSGPLDWTVANRLNIAAGSIAAPASGSVDARLSAPYVLLAGAGANPATGTSTLTVNAQTIDLRGAPTPAGAGPRLGLDFSGFSQVSLIATGDLRLGTLKAVNGIRQAPDQPRFTGNLVAAGDLLLSAQRIYPVSAVAFTIQTPGSVAFAAPAGSDTGIPLSAGGGITVIAKTIDQAGNLFAPLGNITLGNTDSTVSPIITRSVVLEPGSLTSVSLAGLTVPYGATSDGNWYYNASLIPLAQPPSKGLVLAGSSVTRAAGSTIDLRGGGDIQAMEWIQGKGGTRDTLTTTPLGQTVYALVPSQHDPIAAFDIHFATARSPDNGRTLTAGDAVPLVGQQITLDGGGGIPGGTYTLYPAHYATVPGAMRVVVHANDNTGGYLANGTTLADGTVLVTGHATQSTAPGKLSSGQTVFAVQTSPVWQQYSEYNFSGANGYFAQRAAKQNVTAPRVPMDAGRLAVAALESIVLQGVTLAQPGQDSNGNLGRGSELDISAPQLAVVGHAAFLRHDIPAGYVGVDIAGLTGFESILIGGRRSDGATGTLITPAAANVVVDTQGETWRAPEIMLVAQQVGELHEVRQTFTVGSGPNNSVVLDIPVYVPLAGSGTVSINSGSIIETVGAVHAGLGRNYIVASDPQAPVTAASLAAALGGTLDDSGTRILNADLTKLPAAWYANGLGSDPYVVTNSGSLRALTYYANGGVQQPGRGALFVASNDPTVRLSGPTSTGNSALGLTIDFATVTIPPASGLPTGQVTGSLALPGGNTSDSGRVVIADGARISTGTLTLQATAAHNAIVIDGASLHADQVNLAAPSIGVGASTPVADQSLILPASTQFADVRALTLRPFSGPIMVYGDFNPGTRSLTFDAVGLALGAEVDANGGAVSRDARISASESITLKATGAGAFTGGTAGGGHTLALVTKEIDLGDGAMTIAGYSSVGFSASDRVVIKGPGALTLGIDATDRADLTVTTPSILVARAAARGFTITSLAGNVSVEDGLARSGVVDRPADSSEIGGSLTIKASSITVASTIQAQAGTITLNAVAGDVNLRAGAYLAAGGSKATLVDVDTFVGGGKVALSADGGQVITDAASVIDVAQPAGGKGYGGKIDVSAVKGGASLNGILRGGGGPGIGGQFKLDTGGAADLTALADDLLAGGITGAIDIHSRSGNLDLAPGHTLKANAITLAADDSRWDLADITKQLGQVVIRGTLDASGYAGNTADGSGQAGGQVGLFGRNAVVLAGSGQILASTTHAGERGGDVMIGTSWSAAGNIDLQAGAIIDVSGGTRGGLSGGTVTLRAALDGNNDVKIKNIDATITGARAVNIQGFLTINTEASPSNVNGINGNSLTARDGTKVIWDGYVDPAGSLDSAGNPRDFGSWTGVAGRQLNVNPGSTPYTQVPLIRVVRGSTQINSTPYVDPTTGATFQQVTDPVTGTTFLTSLQVKTNSIITITSGGSYTSAPTATVTATNGLEPPPWGAQAVLAVKVRYNNISVSGYAVDNSFNGKPITLYDRFGRSLGSGTAVVVGGVLTTVTITAPASAADLGPLAYLRWNVPGAIPPDVTPDHFPGATLKVDSVQVKSGGSGYTSGVAIDFSGNGGAAARGATMGAAVTITGVTTGYTTAGGLPNLAITCAGCGSGATAAFAPTAGSFSGTSSSDHVFTPSLASPFVPSASSKVFNGSGDSASLTPEPNPERQLFFTDVLANFIQGHGIQGGPDLAGKSYGFDALFSRLQAGLIPRLGAGVVHVQPGIELVNTRISDATNSGNITVASNWNLAAGTAGNLQTALNPATTPGTLFQYFDPATSYVNFTYRLATPWGGLEAGALTLRAVGDINVNASISDGFFQFGNYLDPSYIAWVKSYVIPANGTGALLGNARVIDYASTGLYAYYLNRYAGSAVPIAPYRSAGNIVSPRSEDLAAADLFPHQLRVCAADCGDSSLILVTAPSSWSYSFTAGADLASANPTARIAPGSAPLGTGVGNVTIDKHSTYVSSNALIRDTSGANTNVTYQLPTMVRTGTGRIDIAAAQDVVVNDTVAPGVVYAAGVNTAQLVDPSYTLSTAGGVSRVVVGNTDPAVQQDLFLEPRVLAYGNWAIFQNHPELYYGPPTAAAFPERGGDVRIDAQRDIVGFAGSGNKVLQYYQPWLLSDGGVAPGASILFGAGVFAPQGTEIASQTAWWLQYASFRQGILSAGGNVTVDAGRDLIDVSVSLPTTGRVSGGLSAASTPVTHLYDSGNMLVTAGRDILGGSFYEGSGHATITAGGSVGQNATVSRSAASTALRLPDYPLLAVDTGQMAVAAGGAISIAGVVNPAALHVQQPSVSNPLEPNLSNPSLPIYMATYGPDSKVRLVAETGDLTIALAPTAINDVLAPVSPVYPASFEALALNGSLLTTGIGALRGSSSIPMPGIVLSPSEHGTFELMAQGSIDLSFGYPKDSATLTNTPRPFISAGPSLIDTAFDPFRPNSGFDGPVSGAVLAHKDDSALGIDSLARIYAATGDIIAVGRYGKQTQADTELRNQRIELDRPARIFAGRDIVDLNIIVQNIHTDDVSTIQAGRNISYAGFNNGGGVQVAGPGYLVVVAGGDIGPFLPAAHDNATEALIQQGIVSVGNSSATAVGNIFVSSGRGGGSVGLYDAALLGPKNNQRRNAALTDAAGTRRGADIIAMAGTRFGVNYQAVINAYIDPAQAAGVEHNYTAELRDFLIRIGRPATGTDATVFEAFEALPVSLQQVFVDQVFFAELKAVGITQAGGTAADSQRGYRMINTMFPASLGYTENALGGGSNGANQLVSTGDINLLHGTIQTKLGGDISLFAPGGNILVGSLAAEPNPNLKLRDIGILTLGGGAINTFSDQSVAVNSSRVLTTQGGDVVMWSSNGNLDAGRGAKTTLSAPALQVLYDADDYQSVDLGGFVTGAGIGTLKASSVAAAAQLYLLAPRGTIDFGTAGVRASGSAVFVAPVIANAGNFQVQGTTSGLQTISVPNVGALTAGSNTTGAAAKSADTPTQSGNPSQASVFIVEVIGYGGGDGRNEPPPEKKDSDPQSQ